MNAADFIALLALCAATTFTPGPNTTLSASIAARDGLKVALPFVFGVPLGWSVLLFLCATGLSAPILEHPAARTFLVIAGIAYLSWLATKLLRARPADGTKPVAVVGLWGSFVLQFVNIKAWFLALTIATGWLVGHPSFGSRWWVVWLTVVAFAFTSNFSYACMGASLQGWLRVGRRWQVFNGLMALTLLGLAGWMGITQL